MDGCGGPAGGCWGGTCAGCGGGCGGGGDWGSAPPSQGWGPQGGGCGDSWGAAPGSSWGPSYPPQQGGCTGEGWDAYGCKGGPSKGGPPGKGPSGMMDGSAYGQAKGQPGMMDGSGQAGGPGGCPGGCGWASAQTNWDTNQVPPPPPAKGCKGDMGGGYGKGDMGCCGKGDMGGCCKGDMGGCGKGDMGGCCKGKGDGWGKGDMGGWGDPSGGWGGPPWGGGWGGPPWGGGWGKGWGDSRGGWGGDYWGGRGGCWGGYDGKGWGGPPMGGSSGWGSAPTDPICGLVKSWDEEKGFGFVQGDGIRKMFGKDVFLSKAAVGENPVSVGDQVRFNVSIGPKGPQASEVVILPQGSFVTSGVEGAVYNGTVKNYKEDKGWGFVTSERTAELFKKDIFLHRRELPEGIAASQGETVEFTVKLNQKAVPEAINVKLTSRPDIGYAPVRSTADAAGDQAAGPY